ncbi:hypothetical protein TB2_044096 [Malus domestica]
MNGMYLIDSARQYLYQLVHQEYGAFLGLKLLESEVNPVGYRLFNTIEVPEHRFGCGYKLNWSTCNCPRSQNDSGLSRMERGIHFMGSGAEHARNYCDFICRQNILRPEEYHRAYFLSLLGDMDIGVNEATQVAFKNLLMTSLFDPSSGGPFNVHRMSNG